MGSKFLEKKVKDLAAKKSNKECFDCGKKGVQGNVNLTHHTFVCTRCAGLHRSLGHVAKSIGMHNFTKEQYDGLENGGNKKAHKYWMGKLPDEFKRPDQNEAKMVEFMKWVYTEKRFIKKEGEVKSAQKKKGAQKTSAPKKPEAEGGSKVPAASPTSDAQSFGSQRSEQSSHVSQEAEEDNNDGEGGGVDLLTDFEITEVPVKSVQSEKGGQQSHNDSDGFSDPPASLGSEERESQSQSVVSRSQISSVNRGAVEKLVLALRSVKTEFRLSPSDLESAVEEALRNLTQPLVPSQSASSISSGDDEGNPFEDDESTPPTTTTRIPSSIPSSSLPSSSSSRSIPSIPPSSISSSSSSLFPDLDTQLSPPVSYTQGQTQQSHPQQHMYGRPAQQQGYNYGTPYSYGFNSMAGTYGPGVPGGTGVGGFQNGYGMMPGVGAFPQTQTSVAPAPKGPDLFATLDPFA
jgi:stromal membrane-associated protein